MDQSDQEGPSRIHPALKHARLSAVARLIWDARVSAAKEANWTLGDNRWDIGCKAFSRTKRAITVGSIPGAPHSAWLSCEDRSQHFIFTVGGVPIRVYRGDPEDQVAPKRYAIADSKEKEAWQLAFALADTPAPNSILRIVVDTDSKGFPTGIFLVQVLSDGSLHSPWRIPVESSPSVISMVDRGPKPVAPKKPAVTVKKSDEKPGDPAAAQNNQKGA